jgi:asparagine synthase (glutamine-hydrolysing)
MCGFAGVVTWDEKYRVTQDTLEKMSRAIAHRGPDGEGYYLTRQSEAITPDSPQIGLAFRRLAILDPDPRSNQPFHIGPLTLVFNGEIYNFRELKSEISHLRPDYHWRTTGDTEVLLMAYEVWRDKCVEKLNGMFAFAVWDEQKKELFLARDRMGQKPLFVYHGLPARDGESRAGSPWYFASELNALPKTSSSMNHPIWWGDYLRYGCCTYTPWREIDELAPGTRGFISAHASNVADQYFRAGTLQGHAVDDRTAVQQTRSLIEQAVQRQLVSDVSLGVFLSGGVDSSIVSAAARRVGPIKTFSIRFADARYDESQYARQVSEHLGTEHHEFEVRPEAGIDLPRLAEMFGEPFGDSSALPTHHLARATRGVVKVALSGDGGDELFGGYDRYQAMRFGKHIPGLTLLRPLASLLTRGHPKSFKVRAGRFLATAGTAPSDRYDSYLRIFDERRLRELAPDANFLFPVRSEAYSITHSGARDEVQAALACDRFRYLPDDLLTKVDRCSMMHGLEVRSPFMDHELVQFAAGLTTDQLLKGGPKRMLREAFAGDLPDFVFKRKKMGFAVPIGEWFRGELRPMLRENLFASNSFGRSHFNMKVVERLVEEHETQRVDHSQRLYALLMLELWWQQQK